MPWLRLRPRPVPRPSGLWRRRGRRSWQHRRRDAAAVVGDVDHDLVADAVRRDVDPAFGLARRLDRLQGVHQEVQEDLVQVLERPSSSGSSAYFLWTVTG